MHESLLQILACPMCRTPDMRLENGIREDDEIMSGTIRCAGCRREYPVSGGIPILMPDALRSLHAEEYKAWLGRTSSLERSVLDEDLKTYKQTLKDQAGDADASFKDSYMWEKRLFDEMVGQYAENWDKVPTKMGLKWVRSQEGEKVRNAAAMAIIQSVEGGLKDKRVLNVGSGGDSHLVELFEGADARVVNCDLVLETLVLLRDRSPQQKRACVCGDIRSLPFRTDAFDAVCCMEVVHHIHPIAAPLGEVIRVLKSGHRLFLIELNRSHLLSYPGKIFPPPLKRFIRRKLRSLFKTEDRYVTGSPYEQIFRPDDFVGLMRELSLREINKRVVVHAPALLPEPAIRLWERMGRRFPRAFQRIAMEFAIWGTK